MNLSKEVLIETLNIISSKQSISLTINGTASYAPKILKKDFLINWEKSAFEIHNKIRALSYKGAYALYENKRIKFFDTFIYQGSKNNPRGGFYYEDQIIYIQTGENYLGVVKLQVEGARIISANDFYNTLKKGPCHFE